MIGRFISADSLVPNWYNPQTLDRYGYCSNNPLKYVDPNGDTAWDIIDVISFVDSAITFANNPSLENAAWLAGDTIGLLPGIPGTGTVKGAVKAGKKILKNIKKVENATAAGKKLDKAGDAASAANKADRAAPCFVEGTLIHTENGLISIEEVEASDFVLSRSERTGKLAYRRVLRTFVTPDTPILELKIEDENGELKSIKTTAEHPFWVNGKEWVRAEKLLPGDEVFTSRGGWVRVSGGTWLQERQTVYNFEVDEFHTYFVSECGVWVHNNPCAQGGKKQSKKKPYSNPKRRPKYSKTQAQDVWDASKQSDGNVYDPNTGEKLDWDKSKYRTGQWDMGHMPGEEYRKLHKDYIDGKITKEEFLKKYRDPNNYKPEDPSENRSHKHEEP